ncbi:hypothetical protein C8Q74DRAFT_1222452 [Fomes fomentarius]|nr:hypothetical protein C8Q74DRAFT_1222452 [Fomes fomentarius]
MSTEDVSPVLDDTCWSYATRDNDTLNKSKDSFGALAVGLTGGRWLWSIQYTTAVSEIGGRTTATDARTLLTRKSQKLQTNRVYPCRCIPCSETGDTYYYKLRKHTYTFGISIDTRVSYEQFRGSNALFKLADVWRPMTWLLRQAEKWISVPLCTERPRVSGSSSAATYSQLGNYVTAPLLVRSQRRSGEVKASSGARAITLLTTCRGPARSASSSYRVLDVGTSKDGMQSGTRTITRDLVVPFTISIRWYAEVGETEDRKEGPIEIRRRSSIESFQVPQTVDIPFGLHTLPGTQQSLAVFRDFCSTRQTFRLRETRPLISVSGERRARLPCSLRPPALTNAIPAFCFTPAQ